MAIISAKFPITAIGLLVYPPKVSRYLRYMGWSFITIAYNKRQITPIPRKVWYMRIK